MMRDTSDLTSMYQNLHNTSNNGAEYQVNLPQYAMRETGSVFVRKFMGHPVILFPLPRVQEKHSYNIAICSKSTCTFYVYFGVRRLHVTHMILLKFILLPWKQFSFAAAWLL